MRQLAVCLYGLAFGLLLVPFALQGVLWEGLLDLWQFGGIYAGAGLVAAGAWCADREV